VWTPPADTDPRAALVRAGRGEIDQAAKATAIILPPFATCGGSRTYDADELQGCATCAESRAGVWAEPRFSAHRHCGQGKRKDFQSKATPIIGEVADFSRKMQRRLKLGSHARPNTIPSEDRRGSLVAIGEARSLFVELLAHCAQLRKGARGRTGNAFVICAGSLKAINVIEKPGRGQARS